MRRNSADSRDIDDVSELLTHLQNQISTFEDNFNQRRENRDDASDVVAAAQEIDTLLKHQETNQRVLQDWNAIKTNIIRLSGNYGIVPNWNGSMSTTTTTSRNGYPGRTTTTRTTTSSQSIKARVIPPARTISRIGNSELTGTYRIDTVRSENTDQILSETNVAGSNRQDLQKKLEAPEQIAIRVNGNSVTLASSIASPVTFLADGRETTETDAGGRTVRLHATLKGDELTIASLGGESDYTVIFTPTDNGRSLKVTRRITTEYLQETVFADSVYQKTNDVALLGVDSTVDNDSSSTDIGSSDTSSVNTGSDNGGWSSSDNQNGGTVTVPGRTGPVAVPGRTGSFVVPNGTTLTGMLETSIDTRISQNNDRFRMTVQSPMEYRGAVIEGHVTGVGRSGRVSGRSNVTFNFDTITLRDGKTYDFAGFLRSIRDQNGKTVNVDSEGVARGSSQTKQTAKRGGAGAGIGAVIGAITGGGVGAAVGAIIGGSVGAGSVIVQGRDDVQLYKGSMITVQASSPIRGDGN
jgi:hypothetical protein